MAHQSEGPVTRFINHHYRHFNAAALVDAAKGYSAHLNSGGKMMVTLAGAMSTAELGLSLAEMIRHDKIHLISCTGANLEEDVFNLVAHDYYERVPYYRQLSAQDELDLLNRHMNRVTDTCIPEGEAMRRMEAAMLEVWTAADQAGKRFFPHEFFYQVLLSGKYREFYQIDPKDSWMLAAAEKNLPIIVPGWEDATLGNMYAAAVIRGDIKNVHTVRTGIEYMTWLAEFYTETSMKNPIGMFQIGGGIAGDFPSALCRCSTRIFSVTMFHFGDTSARSATQRQATAATPAPSRMRRLPGANWVSIRQSTSSNPMQQLSLH